MPTTSIPTATVLSDGLEIGKDGIVRKDEKIATAADVPERFDLPTKHPFYGKRVLDCVPSGWPDCTIGADGRLVQVDLKTGLPIGEAVP